MTESLVPRNVVVLYPHRKRPKSDDNPSFGAQEARSDCLQAIPERSTLSSRRGSARAAWC